MGQEQWFCGQYRIRAIHPVTGEICEAILEEDWFGPRKDAIRFHGFNTCHYSADKIAWEFVE